MKTQKPYWEMNTAELRAATREFDAEMLDVPGKPLTTSDRRLLAEARKRPSESNKAPPTSVRELAIALYKDSVARHLFEFMPSSHRTRYSRWVGEAKRSETRERRANEAIKMIRAWGAARGK
jgi:hypothetical protein